MKPILIAVLCGVIAAFVAAWALVQILT